MAAENAGLYLEMLKSHSDHIFRHYNGSPSEDSLPFEETFVPPNTYWTSDEKYKLYHHLQRFSRFRLDLVAEAMGTKTVVEVSTYLGLVARVVHERYSRHAAPRRDRFPAAIEMKNAWVEFEEGMSQYVLEAEDETIRSELAASRRLSCKNAGVVPHHVGVGAFVKESFRMLRSKKLQNGHDTPASKLSSIPTGSLKISWIEEDLFRELDKDNLSVMDDMLDSHYGLDSSSHHAPLASNSDAAHDSHSDDDNPSISPACDSLTDKKGSLEISRTKVAMMSPLERRRYRKRLWMRKKRAQEKLAIEGIDPSFAVFSESTGRLSKRRRTSAMDPFSTPSTVRAFPEDAALGDPMNYQRKRTEKFDLVKKVAQYVNFTAGNLIQDDVDIFYFSRLGNLLHRERSSTIPGNRDPTNDTDCRE
ncbi:uncharacterized protein EI90DRAFT_3087835 [Cantharellus anzutake]|uniref:uncharacterized protein n=1 Tax=Cantharellus anzutake TaxID=1750568 RepID=UPI001906E5C2|nr:uncharacterized protein EI90DRAFT_3087835 [Cantharellus anzutake]KAF8315749.1 hypothetical protein EI90DRAFT_3087835 [Cantharellus anzutake]